MNLMDEIKQRLVLFLSMLESKAGRVGPGMIKGVLITLVMAMALFTLAPTLIHNVGIGVSGLATELSNTTLYGTGAGSIGASLDDYFGYFVVIGALVFLIAIGIGIFKGGRR